MVPLSGFTFLRCNIPHQRGVSRDTERSKRLCAYVGAIARLERPRLLCKTSAFTVRDGSDAPTFFMYIQIVAIGLQRKQAALRTVALQPGTVRSVLSRPFSGGVPNLLEPADSVRGMLLEPW